MVPVFQEYIKSFLLIFIAEMGDKTQILAMAFATQYPVKKVLLGIFFGVLLNHGLAVAMGSLLSTMIPMNVIQMTAGFAFIVFAFWTLKPEKTEEEDAGGDKTYGPVLTVATAFFIGELGDKTQLTAITLSVDAAYPLLILAGTLSGMIVTGGMGIFIGKKLGDKIPEFTIKLLAAGVFIVFGAGKLLQTLPAEWLTPVHILAYTLLVIFPAGWLVNGLLQQRKLGRESAFIRRARELHDYYLQINEAVNQMCLDNDTCQNCVGNECMIGYTKYLIAQGMAEEPGARIEEPPDAETLHRVFDEHKTMRSLALTLSMMRRNHENFANPHLHRIRRNLETILFNRYLQDFTDWTVYESWLESLHQPEADELVSSLRQQSPFPPTTSL